MTCICNSKVIFLICPTTRSHMTSSYFAWGEIIPAAARNFLSNWKDRVSWLWKALDAKLLTPGQLPWYFWKVLGMTLQMSLMEYWGHKNWVQSASILFRFTRTSCTSSGDQTCLRWKSGWQLYTRILPYELSKESSNQPDGPMGSARHLFWPHRTPWAPHQPPLDPWLNILLDPNWTL